MNSNKKGSPVCPKCKGKNTYDINSERRSKDSFDSLPESKRTYGNAKYDCSDCGHSWKKYRGKKPYEQITSIQAFAGGYPGPYFQVKMHLQKRTAEATDAPTCGGEELAPPLKVFSQKEVEWFRAELYRCDFVNWAEQYVMEATDGTNWEVRIEYEDYCEIKTGSNHFPLKWTKFCKAISTMSGQPFY